MMQDEFQVDTTPEGFPVDLTEAEYLAFNKMLAKKMGTLRMQTPILIMFAVYAVVDLVSFAKHYLDTGEISVSMLLIALVTMACAALTLTVVPRRVKKSAKASYLVGNQNGYYGEITVTPYSIAKNLGDETVTILFDEHTVFLEDRDFMAFTAAGQARSIVLPARCMTPAMASQVREAVFAPTARLQRRVFSRMEARASEPMPRRPFPRDPQTLYMLDFQYTDEELKKLLIDMALAQYMRSLPNIAALSILAGILTAVLMEQMFWFPLLSLGFILGYLLLLVISAKTRGQKTQSAQNRTHLRLTDRGVELRLSPSGHRLTIAWQGIERAVERDTAVELTHSGGNLLRIPKRAIPDFDEFRRVVDEYHK